MISPARDWNEDGVGEDDIVVPQQNQIAVYTNSRGDVVIRQHDWPDDDTLILLAPENARRLCDAILRCADFLLDGERAQDDVDDEPTPKPLSNAERQRRYRERRNTPRNERRNGERNAQRNGTVVDLPFVPPLNDDEEVPALAR